MTHIAGHLPEDGESRVDQPRKAAALCRRPRQSDLVPLALPAAAAGDAETRDEGRHEHVLLLLLRRPLFVVVDEFADCLSQIRRLIDAAVAVLPGRAIHAIQDPTRQTEGPCRCAGCRRGARVNSW